MVAPAPTNRTVAAPKADVTKTTTLAVSAAPAPLPDRERLQGRWTVIAATVNGREPEANDVLLSTRHLPRQRGPVRRPGRRGRPRYSFLIDPDSEPGPCSSPRSTPGAADRPQWWLYGFVRNKLRLALDESGKPARPAQGVRPGRRRRAPDHGPRDDPRRAALDRRRAATRGEDVGDDRPDLRLPGRPAPRGPLPEIGPRSSPIRSRRSPPDPIAIACKAAGRSSAPRIDDKDLPLSSPIFVTNVVFRGDEIVY